MGEKINYCVDGVCTAEAADVSSCKYWKGLDSDFQCVHEKRVRCVSITTRYDCTSKDANKESEQTNES